jgi:Xaa-Pro aminopeptidase
MQSDLDALMLSNGLDALLISGPGQHNPPMVYLTGGAHLTDAVLIKKRGQPAVLLHRSMERDEADATGLQTVDIEATYRMDELFRQSGTVLSTVDMRRAAAARLGRILSDHDLAAGRVAVYGQMDAGAALSLFSALQEVLPSLEIVNEWGSTLLQMAMATKDVDEVARIRRMGQITTAVVGQTAEFLVSHTVKDGVLVKKDGRPLTIGDVKEKINLWLAERGAENPKGTIFSIGRDAAVPHTSGNPRDVLRLGQTIIFDIYPCEAGGGYYYDLTRTWCLGYAPDKALALYEDVLAAYQAVRDELRAGAPLRIYQELVCRLFRERGHPTLQEDPVTEQGYVHGLGHGVGLYLHQDPFFRLGTPDSQTLPEGAVVTVEPGLYYPERGLGVRLEDTFWIEAGAAAQPLADYPLDLVLPLKY